MSDALLSSSHRRWNPLRGEWVLVSPQRTQRPWQGQVETQGIPEVLTYDPACYLCPGNPRAGGAVNPDYIGTLVFRNDFAALQPSLPAVSLCEEETGLITAETETGVCLVICFDPRHDLTLATMPAQSIGRVVALWAAQAEELEAKDDIAYVQIFENRGAMMGASNPHPHCQVWATERLPNEPAREFATQREYFSRFHKPMLAQYLDREVGLRDRIVYENDTWVVLIPFWAVWPFETLLIPRSMGGTPPARLQELNEAQRSGLADALKRLASGYDRVFEAPFPYSMGLHPAPCDGAAHPEWTLHVHFFPPLLRSATVRKFMVGFELLGSPQRDITPEVAATRLRQAMIDAAQNPSAFIAEQS